MAVVAGIDEAGYGPILGPLAVAATAFRLPDKDAEVDLWELLRDAVSRGADRTGERVRVADSKKLYRGGNGIEPLERNVLPFLAAIEVQNAECRVQSAEPGGAQTCPERQSKGPSALSVAIIKSQISNQNSVIANHPSLRLRGEAGMPASVEAFLRAVGAPPEKELAAYPWYRGKERPLPRAAAPERIANLAKRLQDGLASATVEFCFARLELLEAAEFNREVAACDNKAHVLGVRVAALMRALWERFSPEGLWLTVDKQGGRNDYEAFLLANFYGCAVTPLCRSAERSRYAVRDGARRMQVTFEAKADSRHLPVALASMLAKYSRELSVEMLNEFWAARVPGLQPTAGYLPDGWRFLEEIEQARQAERIPVEMIRRCR